MAARARRAGRRSAAPPGKPARPGPAQRQAALDRRSSRASSRAPSTWAGRWPERRCTTSRASTSTSWAGRIACSCWRAIPLSCVAVDYLGQTDGSIPCTPARLGRFLVIPENESLDRQPVAHPGARRGWRTGQAGAGGRGRRLDLADARLAPARSCGRPATRGATRRSRWATMPARRRFVRWRRLTPDSTRSGPAFALARSDRELWVASGHSGRFALDPERGSIEPEGADRSARAGAWRRSRWRGTWSC